MRGWLLGHYALAEYRVSGDAKLALSRLEPMADHLNDAALGTVSEIFDGAAPHRPRPGLSPAHREPGGVYSAPKTVRPYSPLKNID